jgi:hypothetical protein
MDAPTIASAPAARQDAGQMPSQSSLLVVSSRASRRAVAALLCAALAGLPGCAGKQRAAPRTPEGPAAAAPVPVSAEAVAAAKAALLTKHGEAARARLERGVDQVATLWRSDDGDLVEFVTAQFAASPAEVDALFARLEAQFEQLDGLGLEMGRSMRWHSEVDTGPMIAVDPLFATFDPNAHVTSEMFTSKIAFAALLNFPLTTLADRLRDAATYSRRQWAEVRLTRRFEARIPGDLAAAASAAEASAEAYIAGYNLWMHHVLGEDGKRRFPLGKRLITHWNLRDELKANYADADGLAKQRTIVKLMERIVTQTIPAAVIDNPRLDWNPFSNEVTEAPAAELEKDAPSRPALTAEARTARENDVRFGHVLAHFAVARAAYTPAPKVYNYLAHFAAARAADAYAPTAPTYLARAFDGAELPEDRVRSMIVSILGSPHVARAAQEIQQRLGRPLGPQDLWYEFGGGSVPEAELDAVTRKRYPTAQAFAADLPRILSELGFTADQVKTLSTHIAVDPSRGAGHAMEARWRNDVPHLRTRVEPGGMDYKGYNIAVHELGHNVEQYLSLYEVDHTLLAGVPNTAFTEALAFLFQARDLQLLGRPAPRGEAEKLRVLDHFWNTFEIAGSALVEMDVWHWLYEHPQATAAELREATVTIARATWDKYYAPVLGGRGETSLLGIYSHTISSPLYLFNYVLGHTIAFQIEEHLAGKDARTFAAEFTRAARQGAVLPDSWMVVATGKPVSADSLLAATERALAGK